MLPPAAPVLAFHRRYWRTECAFQKGAARPLLFRNTIRRALSLDQTM